MTALAHGAPRAHGQQPRNRKFTERIVINFLLDTSESPDSAARGARRLREPLRTLLRSMGALLGVPVVLYEEVRLSAPGTRAVLGVYADGVSGGPEHSIGSVEIRSPDHPAPPGGPADEGDRDRWKGFDSLPNILRTDGSEWSLFRHGTQWGRTVVLPKFSGTPPERIPGTEFERLLWEFLSWRPDGDRTASVLLRRPRDGTAPEPSERGRARVPRPAVPLDDDTGRSLRERPSSRPAPGPPARRSLPTVDQLLSWRQGGVAARRAWMCAPEEQTLRDRWQRLRSAPPAQQDLLLRADGTLSRPGSTERLPDAPAVSPVLHRPFDRRYLLTEECCLDQPRPHLWQVAGPRQVYVVAPHARPPASGPGLLFGSLVPGADCFTGRSRVLPLYRDPEGAVPNLTPGLLPYLADRLGLLISPEDLVAYLAAVIAHPGYPAVFRAEQAAAGVGVPLTADARLWAEAVALGREVVWLHTFGQRFTDPEAGRPPGPPVLPEGERPEVAVAVPDSPAAFPDRVRYDGDTGVGGHRLRVGGGVIARVRPEVWRYDVGGVPVVRSWFGARRRFPHGGRLSPLDRVRPDRWSPRRTGELLELLTVLTRLVRLEPRQADLLGRVRGGPLVTVADLTAAGVLPVPEGARTPPPLDGQLELPLD